MAAPEGDSGKAPETPGAKAKKRSTAINPARLRSSSRTGANWSKSAPAAHFRDDRRSDFERALDRACGVDDEQFAALIRDEIDTANMHNLAEHDRRADAAFDSLFPVRRIHSDMVRAKPRRVEVATMA